MENRFFISYTFYTPIPKSQCPVRNWHTKKIIHTHAQRDAQKHIGAYAHIEACAHRHRHT